MANPEHLKILKQGVEQWNKWGEQHAVVRPDLRGAGISSGFRIVPGGGSFNCAGIRLLLT